MDGTSKHKSLFEKLRRLAEQGVGGEAENAKAKLKELSEKYGVEMGVKTTELFSFSYKNDYERRLLVRCASVVLNTRFVETDHYVRRKGKGARTQLLFDLTPLQASELDLLFDTMKSALTKAFDEIYTAFCVDNLLVSDLDMKDAEDRERSSNEILEHNRFVGVVGKTRVHKRISGR